MRNVYLVTAFVGVLIVSIFGFRGTKFTSPPIEVFPEWAFPGMKIQPKPRAQGASDFFADGRADRPPVERAVMRGMLREDEHLNRGKDATGAFARATQALVALVIEKVRNWPHPTLRTARQFVPRWTKTMSLSSACMRE